MVIMKLILIIFYFVRIKSYPYENDGTVHEIDKWNIELLMQNSKADRNAFENRDQLHFQLADLPWMSAVVLGHMRQ